jgi:D-alanine-D-alanine ligase-like ATP-grasp enzyme
MYKILHFVSPPRTIPPHVVEEIRRDAIRAFYAFGFKDYARFDVRYNPKTELWYFLEGNANPGICLQEDDAMTAAIRAYGMTLEDFIMQLVRNGLSS